MRNLLMASIKVKTLNLTKFIDQLNDPTLIDQTLRTINIVDHVNKHQADYTVDSLVKVNNLLTDLTNHITVNLNIEKTPATDYHSNSNYCAECDKPATKSCQYH